MRQALILFALFICGVAQASDYVVHDGDPAAARALVAERAQRDPAGIQPSSLDGAIGNLARPLLTPQGRVEACTGAPLETNAFDGVLGEAEGDVLYMDYPKAVERLGQLTLVLPCLVGIPAADDLARVWFLQGFANGMLGRDAAARESFDQALVIAPELSWDANFPTTPLALFEEQRSAAGARAKLVILPPADGQVYVDGTLIPALDSPLLLAPGAHLVQVERGEVISFRVHLETEKSHQLVLPGSIADDALAWAADPERRGDLESVLSAGFPADTQLYIVYQEQVTVGRLGGEWSSLHPAWIDPDQRNAQLRDAMRDLRVATPVDFFSTELQLWLTSPGQPRASIAPGQLLQLPLGDSLLEARWGEQEARFPLVVSETPAVISALQGYQQGPAEHEALVVAGSKLPLPWALAVKVGEETVLRELHPGTKAEAFISLDLPLPVGGEPDVHISGSMLGVPGSVRTLHLDPSQHPAIPLHDALEVARSIKRKDFWIAPLGVAVGVGFGIWAGVSWTEASRLAAEARAMDGDPSLIDSYNTKVADATQAQRRSWLTGGAAAVGLGLGLGYEFTLGGAKRRKVAAARATWRAAIAEPVGLDVLTVDWQ